MFKAIAAIATALAAIATMATALVVLLQTQEANRDNPPPGVERPATPLPGDDQPASLSGPWFYEGGSLDLYFEDLDGGNEVFYAFDDFNNLGEKIGEGGLLVDVDAGEAQMFGFDDQCDRYEADLYLLDSWGMEGDIECIDDGVTGGVGFYR